MKRLREIWLVAMIVAYLVPVVGEPLLAWDHQRRYHAGPQAELLHCCEHHTAAEALAHRAVLRCDCLPGHADADRLLCTVAALDAEHRHFAVPVLALHASLSHSALAPEVHCAHCEHYLRRSDALPAAPLLLPAGLRAPPAA